MRKGRIAGSYKGSILYRRLCAIPILLCVYLLYEAYIDYAVTYVGHLAQRPFKMFLLFRAYLSIANVAPVRTVP